MAITEELIDELLHRGAIPPGRPGAPWFGIELVPDHPPDVKITCLACHIRAGKTSGEPEAPGEFPWFSLTPQTIATEGTETVDFYLGECPRCGAVYYASFA